MAATKKKKSTARRKAPAVKAKKPDLTKRYTGLGKLHAVLAEAFPTKRRKPYDVFDVKWLATRLKMTNKALYYWFRVDSLPMQRAREIVAIKGCAIKLEKLLPFVS